METQLSCQQADIVVGNRMVGLCLDYRQIKRFRLRMAPRLMMFDSALQLSVEI